MDLMMLSQIPYLKHGRTSEGCDCYGFARLMLREVGILLPAYDFDGTGGEKEKGLELINATEVEFPEDFDLIYLSTAEESEHVGVFLQGSLWQMTRNGVFSRPWKRISGQVKGVYRVAR